MIRCATGEGMAVPGQLWLLQGPPSRYRMPDPDYAIDQAHPTMTDEIPRLVAHGKLTVKPDIASLDGNRVLFKDGTAEQIDTIVFATGYRQVVPFMDESLIFAADGKPGCSSLCTPHEGLFPAGLAQANGTLRLADIRGR